jgi:hypothetical protein
MTRTVTEMALEAFMALGGGLALFTPQKLLRKDAKPLSEGARMTVRVCGAISLVCNVVLLALGLHQ